MSDGDVKATTVRLIGIGIRTGESWPVKAVKMTSSIVTCEFHRWQFPGEKYTVDFDRVTGKCLDGRFIHFKLDTGNQLPLFTELV